MKKSITGWRCTVAAGITASNPQPMAYYDGCISVDLSAIKPMIALPFHPSNVYEIDTLNQNLTDILREIEIESERVAHGKAKLAAG